MASRTPTSRFAWALLALVQLFVVAVVPTADARLGAEEPRTAHVEGESTDACALQHDHLYCQLCRVADLPAPEPGADRPGVAPTAVRSAATPSGDGSRAPTASDLHLAGPRAPPYA